MNVRNAFERVCRHDFFRVQNVHENAFSMCKFSKSINLVKQDNVYYIFFPNDVFFHVGGIKSKTKDTFFLDDANGSCNFNHPKKISFEYLR